MTFMYIFELFVVAVVVFGGGGGRGGGAQMCENPVQVIVVTHVLTKRAQVSSCVDRHTLSCFLWRLDKIYMGGSERNQCKEGLSRSFGLL